MNEGSGEMEAESNNVDSLEVVSSRGDIVEELDSASKSLTRVLDLACCSEKLVNLDILAMHVVENDSDASSLEELDSFLLDLLTDVVTSGKVISSFKQLGDGFKEMTERLQDCGESLERSFDQMKN
ncbi:WPP domain-interacting tail-anchored protein 1-like [Dorcoceras hygrometricum]|uniref:WPP domain-interacting tail-anchored protein 1-like n=1 Tax=Dorcoceras hygrometricum TaxID=472368 RepID=A0A2Z7BGA6_9LAMI|nr:WPP domain-interacting tail-anchored protein 1-like [Dorcoceras hygrometricum]